MTITAAAVAAVQELGYGTVDDVLPLMPGYTRTQAMRALKNAAYTGRIDTDGWKGPQGGPKLRHRATGKPRGSRPTTYRAKKAHRRAPASVWDFAQQIAA